LKIIKDIEKKIISRARYIIELVSVMPKSFWQMITLRIPATSNIMATFNPFDNSFILILKQSNS